MACPRRHCCLDTQTNTNLQHTVSCLPWMVCQQWFFTVLSELLVRYSQIAQWRSDCLVTGSTYWLSNWHEIQVWKTTPAAKDLKSALVQTISLPVVLPNSFPHWAAHGDDVDALSAIVDGAKEVMRIRAGAKSEGRIFEGPRALMLCY